MVFFLCAEFNSQSNIFQQWSDTRYRWWQQGRLTVGGVYRVQLGHERN